MSAEPVPTDPTEIFETHRPRLVGLAYRMLGSLGEAEDVVQETYLRWHRQADGVIDAGRWLRTVTGRLCLDQLRSARVRREQYKGPWLPEPVPTDGADPAVDPAELADSLSMAMLAVLERLSPAERAAFLLREVFDYGYGEVAEVVGKNEAACRQLVHRAKRRLAEERPRFEVDRRQKQDLVDRFVAATRGGDLQPLVHLLDEQVTLWSDGGGKVPAALRPIYGADRVMRLLLGVSRSQPDDLEIEIREINGEPGILLRSGGRAIQTFSFDLHRGRAVAIYAVRNPDKLRRFDGDGDG
ncbi:MAG: RNA polymerase sigma-70 factor [Acidobacteriota bacterium]